jgi:parvulin-like peptidyl-prolyl isomerase
MKMRSAAFFLILILFFSIGACSSKDEKAKDKIQESKEEPEKLEDLLLVESETIKIHASNIWQDLVKAQKASHGKGAPAKIEDLAQDIIETKTNMYYVFEDSKKNGFFDSNDAKIIRSYYNGKAKEQGVEKKIREDILPTIKEDDIAPLLPKSFEKLILRKIIVKSKEDAEDMLEKVKAGEDFIELVKKYSTGPSAGLRFGLTDDFFPEGDYFSDPKDEDVAFSLKEGELYDGFVKSPLGYMIYKIEKKFILSDKEIEEFRNRAKGDILSLRRGEYLQEIREKYKDKTKNYDEQQLADLLDLDMNKKDRYKIIKDEVLNFNGLSVTYNFLKQMTNVGILERRDDDAFTDESFSNNYSLLKKNAGSLLSYLMLDDYFKEITITENQKRYIDDMIKREVALHYMFEKFKDLTITEEDAKKFYEDSKHRLFTRKASARVKIIFLPTKEDALKVLERYGNGEDFSELAKELSIEEKTRETGGLIGWVKADSVYVPEKILGLIFKTKAGEVSEPIETENGDYVIVKVVDLREERVAPYEEAKRWAEKMADEKKIADARTEYFRSLRSKDNIVKYDENIDTILEAFKRMRMEKLGVPLH